MVIAILGLLTALVGPRLFNILGGAKKSLATQQIENIGGALDLYKLDVGSYPTGDQGLAALATKPNDVDNWNGPYTKTGGVPQDPWNHPWTYHSPSTRQGPRLRSLLRRPPPAAPRRTRPGRRDL
ncbi:MAG: type II secretion system major pseudopilin GspG [Rhodospirillales bacterium]